MTLNGVAQIVVYWLIILALAKPVGVYLSRVFNGHRTFLHPPLRWLEMLCYRAGGVDPQQEQRWTQYAISLLAFSAASFLLVYAMQRLQGYLPLNPQHLGAQQVSPDLAFNTAISFVTNTNWQSYAGETTLSYFVQMAALTVQNFVSAAAGVAMSVALIRGFARRESKSIGNFWADLTRATIYVFLPLAFVGALVLCSQGVIQTLRPNLPVRTVQGATQVIPGGPVASQEAIKMVGTNGGGFFNANSAHPYENPTPLSDYVEMLFIFLIPAGLAYMFGRDVGDMRQGWALFAAMSVMFLAGAFLCYHFEQRGNPMLARLGLATRPTTGQPGGNMEGKEVRFGIADSALFATITTDASCGAVNSMHDSFTPLGGLVPLVNILTGEVIFGGAGAGLEGLLLFAILAVFIAGLMVGRTPEYVGKKIEQKEVKLAMVALIAAAASILVFTALSSVLRFPPHGFWNPPGPTAANVANPGPHGFSEILYAYASATGNNGSAFAGLNSNTPWYNLTLGLAMFIGRFIFLLPLLGIAGSLAAKKRLAVTSGTFPTHGPLFVGLLIGTVVLVAALTFFPALSLGPIAERYLLFSRHAAAAVKP
ncbi:MAG: potassium-transporting ATPase subunit KdpA [Terriglobales bacterium]